MATPELRPGDGLAQQLANHFYRDSRLAVSPTSALTVAALTILLLLAKRVLYPTFDPREPPVVRPRIPMIGHIVAMLTRANDFYLDVARRSGHAPICTLPMLAGKMYVVYSPTLIQAAMRSRDLSFEPFMEKWSADVVGVDQEIVDVSMPHNDRLVHNFVLGLSGENLYRTNEAALRDIAREINAIGGEEGDEEFRVPDLWAWIRRVISLATFRALFGERNPLDEEDAKDFAEFEGNFAGLALGGLSGLPVGQRLKKLLGGRAMAARDRIQKKLLPYILAGGEMDPSTSPLIRLRAVDHAALGIGPEGRAKMDFLLPWVGTLNTIPTLFWFFTEVFSRADYVARVRDEVLASGVITILDGDDGKRVATVDIVAVEKLCPFLMACYRETLRVSNENVGNRIVMRDTTLSDGAGREYLLTAGTNIQWSASTTHKDGRVWASPTASFNPANFFFEDDKLGGGGAVRLTPDERAARRLGLIPFGGGKHLCPGRNFAQAENLSLVAALAVGFEVEGAKVPASVGAPLGAAARQPVWGGMDPSVRIRRKEGWRDVEWRFTCREQEE